MTICHVYFLGVFVKEIKNENLKCGEHLMDIDTDKDTLIVSTDSRGKKLLFLSLEA